MGVGVDLHPGSIRENKSLTRRTFVVGAIRAQNNKDDNNAHRL